MYYWTQQFPANSTIELVQRYQPVVGGSYILADDDGNSSIKPFCGASEALQRIKAVKKLYPVKNDGDVTLVERRIDYILTTANNWKGPVRNFHLAVLTDSPDDILVSCTPGLQRINATRYN